MADQLSEITCPNPNCKIVIGVGVDVKNLRLIQVGGLVIRDVKANCAKCGTAIYWNVSDKELMEFVRAMFAPAPPVPEGDLKQ